MSTTEAPTAVSTNATTPGTAPAESAAPAAEPKELGPTADFAPTTEASPESPAPVPAEGSSAISAHIGTGTAREPGPGHTSRVGPIPTPPATMPASKVSPATAPPATIAPAGTPTPSAAPVSPSPASPAPTAPNPGTPAASTATPAAPPGARPRRPMRADARRNYDRLLAAADAAFTQHGAEASLEDIARRAAVGIGTLYRHFPTRQILLEATFGGRLDALRDEADNLASTTPPMQALTSWLRSLLRYVTEFRGLSELVMTTMRNRNSELHASGAGMRRAGGRLLSRAQATGEDRPDLDDADLILMVNGIVWAAERVPGDDHAQRLLAVMIDGLRPGRIAAA